MSRIFILFFGVALLVAGCGDGNDKTPARKKPPSISGQVIPLGPLPDVAKPRFYRVALTIDPRKDIVEGHVEIDVNFERPARSLFIHGLGLNMAGVSVRLKSHYSVTAHYQEVHASGVALLIFVEEIPKGKATLVFDYEAPYGKSLRGLYKTVENGDPYIFTQFEATEARRAFPSFDEPGFKTPFAISISAPARDRAISNAPEKSRKAMPGGLVRTVFQTTRPLPTYLVSFSVGPFDIVDGGMIPPSAVRKHPVPFRGIAAKGKGPQLAYAMSQTPKVFLALEDYFGIAYPFQKIDMIAVPDFGANGMENAGAINYRERHMFVTDKSPLNQKRQSLLIQVHELAHQWFGDLVTPKWWSDIWLNEAFARWMEPKIAQTIAPRQDYATQTVRAGLSAMNTDELPSTRQIHQPVKEADDIANVFDTITYDKGAAVLAMFENFAGPENFRQGIRTYLRQYAFKNAATDDFLAVMTEKTRPELGDAMRSFIGQSGVPLVSAEIDCSKKTADVKQSAFAALGGSAAERNWKIPLCLAGKSCSLLDTAAASIAVKCPMTPNPGGAGYYRYTTARWQGLISVSPKLPQGSQIALLENLYADVRAGRADPRDLLSAIRTLAPTARWDVLSSVSDILLRLRQATVIDNDLPAYRAYVGKAFAARYAATGAIARRGESPSQGMARQYLIGIMVGEARDPAAIQSLAKLAQAALNRPNRASLAAEVRGEAFRAGLIADPAFADQIFAAFDASNDESFRRDIAYAIAGSDDPNIIQRLLELILTDKVKRGEARGYLQMIGREASGRLVMWPWFSKNFKKLSDRFSERAVSAGPAYFAEACDTAMRDNLEDFFRQKKDTIPGLFHVLALADERIDRCIAFREGQSDAVGLALRGK